MTPSHYGQSSAVKVHNSVLWSIIVYYENFNIFNWLLILKYLVITNKLSENSLALQIVTWAIIPILATRKQALMILMIIHFCTITLVHIWNVLFLSWLNFSVWYHWMWRNDRVISLVVFDKTWQLLQCFCSNKYLEASLALADTWIHDVLPGY